MMKNFLLTSIEKAINKYIHTDSSSRKRLAKLAGKAVSIELLPINLIFTCHFHPDNVTVSMNHDSHASATIKGTPMQLFGMLISKEHRQEFFAEDVVMEGDAEVAQQVLNLFEKIRIDWEEQASKVIGDVPAHQLGRLASRARKWLDRSSSSFSQDINDYLHEEKAWFPHREELQDFFNDIDTIRMDTDRMEARLTHLFALLNKEESQ